MIYTIRKKVNSYELKNNGETLQVIHIAITPNKFEKDGITIYCEYINESTLRKNRDFLNKNQ